MNLKDALEQWPDWSSAKPSVVKTLGGFSNSTYLLQAGIETLVIRINQAEESLGVDREREALVLSIISDYPFSPKVIFNHPHYLVSEYLSKAEDKLLMPEEMGTLFQQIHKVAFLTDDITASAIFDAKAQIAFYYQQISEPHSTLDRCIEYISHIDISTSHTRLCHHDLLPENIIQSTKGIKILDWEYAQQGNPLFDLAIYAESLALTKAETCALIKSYDDSLDESSLEQCRLVYCLMETLWWKIKKPQMDISSRLKKLTNRMPGLR
ncbi:MAG: thiamine kinase [Flavobacterium sp.]|jgi:thiamine kinase